VERLNVARFYSSDTFGANSPAVTTLGVSVGLLFAPQTVIPLRS
jgi:hypothetical protein